MVREGREEGSPGGGRGKRGSQTAGARGQSEESLSDTDEC